MMAVGAGGFLITKGPGMIWPFAFAVMISLGIRGLGEAHTGIVDGYGCHQGPDKSSYHCHQGQFVGRTFKSKEDFLRQLRSGKAQSLTPKSNPEVFEKKPGD
jgi:hypothetical protein